MKVERIREAELEALIVDEHYRVEGVVTVALLDLASGFVVVGHSACLNPDDFNDTIGRQVAREKAFEQLWALEGYHRKAVAYAAAKGRD